MSVSTQIGQTAFAVTPVPADLGGRRAHQADRGVLGGRVRSRVARADEAGHRCHGHDPSISALDHAADHRPGAEERPGGVDVEMPAPVLERRSLQRRAPGDAGVVDEHVDRPACSKNSLTISSSVTSSRSRPTASTRSPRAAKRSATALPMPFVPPVTTTSRLSGVPSGRACRRAFAAGRPRTGSREGPCGRRGWPRAKSLSSCSSSGSLATM